MLIKIRVNMQWSQAYRTLGNITSDFDVDLLVKVIVEDRRQHPLGEYFLRAIYFLNP